MRSNILSLNIAPVSISYEYDACDYLKAQEFQAKRDNAEFKKSPKDEVTLVINRNSREYTVKITLSEYKGE